MKKLALSALLLGSSLATASQVITLEPGTYKKIDYVTVYCYDWGTKAPASSRWRVNLNADGFQRCTFSTLTYKQHKVTRVFSESTYQINRPAKMRGDLLQLELDRAEKQREEMERRQAEEGWRISIPIFSGQF